MANWSYYRPGISDRAPLNLTNADGSKKMLDRLLKEVEELRGELRREKR